MCNFCCSCTLKKLSSSVFNASNLSLCNRHCVYGLPSPKSLTCLQIWILTGTNCAWTIFWHLSTCCHSNDFKIYWSSLRFSGGSGPELHFWPLRSLRGWVLSQIVRQATPDCFWVWNQEATKHLLRELLYSQTPSWRNWSPRSQQCFL